MQDDIRAIVEASAEMGIPLSEDEAISFVVLLKQRGFIIDDRRGSLGLARALAEHALRQTEGE